jgi:hypothetical protein
MTAPKATTIVSSRLADPSHSPAIARRTRVPGVRRYTPASQPMPMPATMPPTPPDSTTQSGSALRAGITPNRTPRAYRAAKIDRPKTSMNQPPAISRRPSSRRRTPRRRPRAWPSGKPASRATSHPAAASPGRDAWAIPVNEVTNPTIGRIASRHNGSTRGLSPRTPSQTTRTISGHTQRGVLVTI